MADAEMIIDSKINTSEIQPGINEIEAGLKRGAEKVQKIAQKMSYYISDAFAPPAEAAFGDFSDEGDIKWLTAQIEEYEEKLRRMQEQQRLADELGMPHTSAEWKTVANDISAVEAMLADYKRDLSTLVPASPNTSTSEEIQKTGEKAAEAKVKVRTYTQSLRETADTHKKTASAVKSANHGFNNFGKSINKGFRSILKYAFGIRTLQVLFNKLRKAIKDGFENLAQFSPEVNSAFSSIKSSLTQLKNSTATALSPLLTAIAPVLTKVINLLSTAATNAGMFIAQLMGQNKFTRAIAVQEDYAKSLNNTADAAKDAKSQVMGFDQLNIVSDNKENGGSVSPSSMFETVELEQSSKLRDFYQKIKDIVTEISGIFATIWSFVNGIVSSTQQWLSQLNLNPLTTAVKGYLSNFGKLISTTSEGLTDVYNDILLPLGTWYIEDAAPVSVDIFSEALRLLDSVCGNLFDGILDFWDKTKDLRSWMQDTVVSVLKEIKDGVKSLADTFDEKGENIKIIISSIGDTLDFQFKRFAPWLTAVRGVLTSWLGFILKWVSTAVGFFSDLFTGIVMILSGLITHDFPKIGAGFQKIFGGWIDAIKKIYANIKDLVSRLFNTISTFIGQAFDKVKTKIEGIVTGAIKWGKDLIDNLKKGLTNGIPKIAEGAKSIAGAIASFLHFSEPDKGPLSNFHTFMPDMIDLMVDGIASGRRTVVNAVRDLGDAMSDEMNDTVLSPRIGALSSRLGSMARSFLPEPQLSVAGAVPYRLRSAANGGGVYDEGSNAVTRALSALLPNIVGAMGGETTVNFEIDLDGDRLYKGTQKAAAKRGVDISNPSFIR